MKSKKVKKPQKLQIKVIGGPRAEVVLKEAIQKGNWVEGIVLSKEYLENYLYYRLRNYLGSKRIRAYPFLKGMPLWKMAWILKELRVIDDKTYSLIREVNAYRNKMLHEYDLPEQIEPKEAKRIIEKAMECFEAIISSYESMK